MRTIRDLSAAFLFGLLLLWATTAHACGFGYSSSYGYSQSFVSVQAYAYVPTVAYIQYQAPAAYTYAQSYATPCPAAVVAAPQAEAYTSSVPVTIQETQLLQTYSLPRAVNYLATTYGCSAEVALSTLRIFGHREAVAYTGNVNALIVEQRRGFFGRNRTTVIASNGGAAVAVEVGRRGFFGGRTAVSRSVTHTRTRIR